MKTLHIYTDGGARGNPGPAGIGVVACSEKGDTVGTYSCYLGEATNNIAEYEGLVAGFKLARELGATDVRFFLDSKLVVEQMKGTYRVKNGNLAGYVEKARALAKGFKSVSYTHIPREKNKPADALVNEAIDLKKTDPGESAAPPKDKSIQLDLL